MNASAGSWIPKDLLVAANVLGGASWLVLFWLAEGPYQPGSLPSLAWVHLVALGWLSLASLAVLIHVIPAFTGVAFRFERVARWAARGFALAALLLVSGFALASTRLLEIGGTGVVASLVLYLVPVALTLGAALRGERLRRAIARALMVVLATLLVAALLGFAMTLALGGNADASLLTVMPARHAVLAIAGWLSLLIFGVFTRTRVALTGVRSRAPLLHVVSSTLALGGVYLFVVLPVAGGALLAGGTLLFAADLFDGLVRRRNEDVVPQAYLAAAGLWLVAAVVLGTGTLAGSPWAASFAYVALIGWIGQMVNAHVYHIGVRLLITTLRGDEDETRPWLVVSATPALTGWMLTQLAVAAALGGLLAGNRAIVASAGLCGFAGWAIMIATLALSYRRVRALPSVLYAG